MLHAKKVIHTVGPIYNGREEEKRVLADCYKNSLNLAKENSLQTIAFPGISTGLHGFPSELASEIAVKTVVEWLKKNPLVPMRVIFISYDDKQKQMYDSLIDDYADFIITT